MNKLFFFTIAVVLFLPYASAAELVLDLDKAVETALVRNFSLEQARKDYEVAYWSQRIALSNYLPQIRAGFAVEKHYNQPVSGRSHNYRSDLTLRQSLVNLGQIADIRAASSERDYRKQQKDSFKQVIIYDVLSFFYRSLLDEQKLRIRKGAVLLAKEEMGIAKARYKEGVVSYYDLLRSETRYLTAESQLRQAKSEYQKSLNKLKNILGYGPSQKISLKGEFGFAFDPINYQDLVQEVATGHPQFAAAKYLIRQMKQRVSSARADFVPRLDLEAVQSLAHRKISGSGGLSAGSLDNFGSDNYWTAYLRVSLPLFEGARRYSQLKKTYQQLERAELEKDKLLSDIKKDINSFYQDYLSAQELVVSQKKNLDKSEELYRLVRRRYKLGESSEIELLDAHLNLIDVEIAYKEAQYQAIVSYYGMFLAAGQLDLKWIEAYSRQKSDRQTEKN